MEHAALIASAAFLGLLTALGVWHARQIKTAADFALAGRRLPMGVVAGTLVATWIGTGSLFGSAEFAYAHGWQAMALPVAGGAGILCLAFLAPRVRSVPADSLPQVLGQRFGRGPQLLGAFALIGAYLIIVSYQYRAGAAVMQFISPDMGERLQDVVTAIVPALGDTRPEVWDKAPGVIVFGMFVILYTALAGMVSVAWTDVLNGVVMAGGLLLTLAYLIVAASGSDAALPVASDVAVPVESVPMVRWIGILLPSFLLVLGDANLYQRFMSARSPASARISAVWMLGGVLILEWAIIGIACLGRLLLPVEPENHGYTIIAVAFSLVPSWLGVLLVMSTMAVIVTTADSYLLGSATSVSADLAGGLSTAAKQRGVAIVLGLLAMGLAFVSKKFFDVALYAYTLYGATLTPAVVAALLFEKTPRAAVMGGMIAGLATALAWKLAATAAWLPASFGSIEPVLPALGMNLLTMGTLAWVARSRESEHER